MEMIKQSDLMFFLLQGKSDGCIRITDTYSNYVIYRLPKSEFEWVKENIEDLPDLNKAGVYFLIGRVNEELKLYVGQAIVRANGKSILCRIDEHNKDHKKDFYTDVIFLTSKSTDAGIDAAMLCWLENRFVNLSKNGYYGSINDNSNTPNSGNVNADKIPALNHISNFAEVVMSLLGYNVFEPNEDVIETEIGDELVDNKSLDDIPEGCYYYMNKNKSIYSIGKEVDNGFIVSKGSRISSKLSKTIDNPKYNFFFIRRLREQYKHSINDKNELTDDIQFDSMYQATCFVLGRSDNSGIWIQKTSADKKEPTTV